MPLIHEPGITFCVPIRKIFVLCVTKEEICHHLGTFYVFNSGVYIMVTDDEIEHKCSPFPFQSCLAEEPHTVFKVLRRAEIGV